jgi:hypothetical protein
VLARYEQSESVSEEDLREQLRATAENWPRLQLCLRPRADEFLPDVTRIAEEFGIDRATLAAIVRRVEAIEVVREQPQPGEAGSLLAARTRKRTTPPPEAPNDE